MKYITFWFGIVTVTVAVLISWVVFGHRQSKTEQSAVVTGTTVPLISNNPQSPVPTPPPLLNPPPERIVLDIPVHYFQTFNNCGPATLAMTLSFFDINRSQQQLGNELRPYQNATGDNDDKSVTLEELAAKGEELGLVSYHRPAGSIELLQQLTANNIPVITRTWTHPNEDIGHYRVVTGYDQTQRVIIQDDSLQGEALSFPYQDFLTMWEKFNYEFLVLVPPERIAIAEAILGPLTDQSVAWQIARQNADTAIQNNPTDTYAQFNMSVALYNLGDYQGSVATFEQVENQLPFRTLWYQLEPLEAYYQLGRYPELLIRIEHILTNGNRAYSELYYLRGQIYLNQGNPSAAQTQFELAIRYNSSYLPARQALAALSNL